MKPFNRVVIISCIVAVVTALAFAQAANQSKGKLNMNPNPVTVNEKKIIGIETRTTNRAEANSQSGKIGPLWQKFFQVEGGIPNKKNANLILGTYTKYESDFNGEYTLIVSSEVTTLDNVPDGMVGTTIPAGRYLVFTAKGEIPQALIETWMSILDYFSRESKYQRAYTTDFEITR